MFNLFNKNENKISEPIASNMTDEEYLNKRLEDQIKWYSSKSQSAQRKYKRLKKFEIIVSLSFTVLGTYASHTITIPCLSIGITIGFIITVISAVSSYLQFKQSLEKYHENWILYRQTCELLKHEKFLYITRSGGYATANNPFNDLVDRCESIISSENIDWAQLHKSTPQPPCNHSSTTS